MAALLLNQVAAASGIEQRVDVPLVDGERLQSASIVADGELQALLAGRVLRVLRGAEH